MSQADAQRLRIEELESRLADLGTDLDETRSQVGQLKSSLELASEARRAAEMEAELCKQNAVAATGEMQHFVYAVSHDLRQPLRAVLANSQMLSRSGELSESNQELCSYVIQGAQEMNARIERMLTFSRTASNLRRSIVPLSAVVQWTTTNIEPLITASGARISDDNLPVAEVDDSALSALFRELFTNSILYRREETPVIFVTSEPHEDSHVISVIDNGCGVGSEYHEKVFQPFTRLHGPETPGFGLGLAIARKIVNAHGGRIWLESDGKTGSIVRFTLPG